ncbi:hypothetical protein [Nocardia stercoris]|uniref:Uncharacterized protein n=1 Tax=Nocardia stercoris TaxID=2483361 RepID=A0A3M2LCJ4_9NOCA|nr:hypothetical protein [Nocardia stercoris]RMI35114.1 hypothetical protein EBN03_02025 [Nocardia stercoris]
MISRKYLRVALATVTIGSALAAGTAHAQGLASGPTGSALVDGGSTAVGTGSSALTSASGAIMRTLPTDPNGNVFAFPGLIFALPLAISSAPVNQLLCGDAGSSAGELFYDWTSQTCQVVTAG